MVEQALGNTCKYARECPLFQGTDYKEELPHFLYKNVFCMRGYKGWKNCIKFEEFEKIESEEHKR